jgi:hypothetical protein
MLLENCDRAEYALAFGDGWVCVKARISTQASRHQLKNGLDWLRRVHVFGSNLTGVSKAAK